jgi:universal stress protein A
MSDPDMVQMLLHARGGFTHRSLKFYMMAERRASGGVKARAACGHNEGDDRTMRYKHVLAAVDLTEEATEVLAMAREVADEHGARLSVVTVVKPLTHVYGGLDMVSYTQVSVNFEEEARAQAQAQVEALAAPVGIPAADVHVSVGSPVTQIIDDAERLGADLIVVGSHGKHGLGLLLGSTANGVLHRAACDVLTIRIKD